MGRARLIDSHAHVWSLARGDYPWPTPHDAALYRDFAPADLRADALGAGLAAVVLVQAAPTDAETRHLLAVADGDALVGAVVGWVDFTDGRAPETLADLADLARHPRFRGVRPMLQDLPPAWILDPRFDPVFDALIRLDLTFDALVRPAHLPALGELLRRHPRLRLVIDHGAKPVINTWEPWASDIAALAAAGAHVKLSGLLTEAGGDAEAARPYAEHLLNAFTPDRILWGSDWPVLRAAGTYRAWLDWCRALVAQRGDAAADAIFGGTAARFYGVTICD